MSEKNTPQTDVIALVDSQGNTMTYDEVNRAGSALDSLLSQYKIGSGSRVAILLEKSFASTIGIYTSLKISAAYIPIDIHLPKSRIEIIIADSRPHVVLHNQPRLFPGKETKPCEIPGMEGCFITLLLQPNYGKESEKPNYFRTAIAYILYTSGSSGIPKGVCVSLEAANAFIRWSRETFPVAECINIASVAPFHFDLSILDLFIGRHKNTTLHLFCPGDAQNPRLMSEQLASRKINFIYATPTFYSALLEFGKMERQDWSPMRHVLFAGEVFPVKKLHQLMKRWDKAQFYNLYGPTETNVCAFTKIERNERRNTPYPIGKICVDHEFEITSNGELLVGGAHVANEYLNLPELTAEKFFTKNNKRWFRTGDYVELDESGNLVYKGRLDRMVKRRGYRIEPGEIETALHKIKGIQNAAVIAQSRNDNVLLTAAITTDGSQEFDIVKLKTELVNHLPDYMLPDSVITVKEFPKTSSGKIDYLKLSEEVVSSLGQ